MQQNLIDTIKTAVQEAITNTFKYNIAPSHILIETCKRADQGDFATTVVFNLTKLLKQSPHIIGNTLVDALKNHSFFEKVCFAPPGFINFTLKRDLWPSVLPRVLEKDPSYFQPNIGKNARIYLEYISANPTGPLHVGHARCAALGSFLATLLKNTGHQVFQEYLINDAGFQIQTLGLSVWLKHQEKHHQWLFPKKTYQGEYISELADFIIEKQQQLPPVTLERCINTHTQLQHELQQRALPLSSLENEDDKWLEDYHSLYGQCFTKEQRQAFEMRCCLAILEGIQYDCTQFAVHMDHWFSEKTLHDSGAMEACITKLKPHTYEQDGALWFASSKHGDTKDRVLRRSNGEYTYFAADCAYHLHKLNQSYDKLIDIFGADHHGYVARIKAAVACMSTNHTDFDVIIYQFVNLTQNKQPVQMSTRQGTYITLAELAKEVGCDSARYYLLAKKPDMHISFDLEEAKATNQDNPIYRIHYAHARCVSVLRKHPITLKTSNYQHLTHPLEVSLLKSMHTYPNTLAFCVQEQSAHSLCQFLLDFSGQLHSYYAQIKIDTEDLEKKQQRLHLIEAVRQVLHTGLSLLGITAKESM